MTLDLEVAAILICTVSLSYQSCSVLILLTKCLPHTCVDSIPIVSFPMNLKCRQKQDKMFYSKTRCTLIYIS